ncbi:MULTISPECIES: Crp/Fnr family transcriptional regulator [unclassified Ectothiorhodospira]|uniref:Crp/Fnr family transcriptional regulator n=1 Tax=unclassified Ectothiorhodospira TaxID=2684909 RepID=UPI001EE992B1|nr:MULTISPECIES: Crp/Fnr family transcriptional regulator [unclassified Ectothiorhodospira]MCG5516983.1 Crp/Fnr family transcriptional regulator [Ectothiorhodospira sp. 9100]MCG5520118.1 Crp/Fnr family transcriptional regulator [Ectothiorhodospira sp. 9905]
MNLQELQRLHLFEPLDSDQLGRIQSSLRERHYRAGEPLFAQGDPAAHFFLVKSGTMKLYLLSRDGDEKVVEVIQSGQLFAEAVMFMDERRYPVNASALSDTHLVIFDNSCFLQLLAESPDLALKLLGILSRRMHGLLSHIDELTLHNATYRLVSYLLAQVHAQAGQVRLAIPKQVIASRLSMKPETLSRILGRLREQGLLAVQGETLVLLDEAGLRRVLE